MPDGTAVVGVAGGTAWVLGTEAGKKLIGPLAENLGLALGDLGDIYRFYQRKNLGKVFTKWAEARNQRPISEEEVNRVLPLLRLASEQGDEDLQTKWASLLETTAASDKGIPPSFGHTLAQMTSQDAKLLDRLFAWVSRPGRHGDGHQFVQWEELVELCSPATSFANPNVRRVFKGCFTPEQLDSFEGLEEVSLRVTNLERLGLLMHETWMPPDAYARIPSVIGNLRIEGGIAGKSIAVYNTRPKPTRTYQLSPYGMNFAFAVKSSLPDATDPA
jgi:hypothetical protein